MSSLVAESSSCGPSCPSIVQGSYELPAVVGYLAIVHGNRPTVANRAVPMKARNLDWLTRLAHESQYA
jgi:hypothetical protein